MAINDFIFHYELDNDYTDNGSNGTGWSYGTTFVDEGSRKVMLIDAIDDAMLLNASVSAGTIGLSLYYKGNPSPLVTYRYMLGSTSTDDTFLVIRESDNEIGHIAGGTFYASGETHVDGLSTHYAVSKNGTSIKIWKNKTLIYDDTTATLSPANFRGLGNFGFTNSRDAGSNGTFKEFYGFDHTLSQTDVNDLYALDAPPPKATASVVVTATASAVVTPKATASVVVTATATPAPIGARTTANIVVTANAFATISLPDTDLFSFVYSIQRAVVESNFKFIYSLEQPKTSTIIERVII